MVLWCSFDLVLFLQQLSEGLIVKNDHLLYAKEVQFSAKSYALHAKELQSVPGHLKFTDSSQIAAACEVVCWDFGQPTSVSVNNIGKDGQCKAAPYVHIIWLATFGNVWGKVSNWNKASNRCRLIWQKTDWYLPTCIFRWISFSQISLHEQWPKR